MEDIFLAVADLKLKQQSGALCTIIQSSGSTPRHAGSKMLVYEDGHFIGTVGGGEIENRVINEAVESLKGGKPRLLTYNMVNPEHGDPGVCGGEVKIYVEPILPEPVLLLIGSGHVGKAVIHLAKWLGFRVAVSDDRAEFCSPESLPEADEYYPCPIKELPEKMRFTPQTIVILTTRGADVDVDGLPSLCRQPFAYMGVIGSRRRWAVTHKALIEQGVSEDCLSRIHSPVGLEIHAETPQEIAVSILAEVLMVRNAATGKSMKD